MVASSGKQNILNFNRTDVYRMLNISTEAALGNAVFCRAVSDSVRSTLSAYCFSKGVDQALPKDCQLIYVVKLRIIRYFQKY